MFSELLAQAEVNQFDITASFGLEHEVLRLDVSVYDKFLVQVNDGANHFSEVNSSELLSDGVYAESVEEFAS